jgi:hypothetical protein
VFDRVDFEDVDVTITSPLNNVLVLDCTEDSDVTLAGTTSAWQRAQSIDRGASSGVTTGNSPTKTWSVSLDPGQLAYLDAKVVGRQRNGEYHSSFHVVATVYRPGASLAYDTQTGNFTVGNVLTGANSGATGRIIADDDAGATGTLTLQDVVGAFEDDEIITDGATGSATANGTQSTSDAQVLGRSTTLHRLLAEADLDYDAQSANFTLGLVATGATSNAKGTITADTDTGTAGTLTLKDVVGVFQDNEALTDSGSGAAVVDGVLSAEKYAADFVANGPEVELRVTGAASETVEWTAQVEVST